MPFYYMPAAEQYFFFIPLRTGTLGVAVLHIICAMLVFLFLITRVWDVSDMCHLDYRLNDSANLAVSNYSVRCGYHFKCCGKYGNNYHCPAGPHIEKDSQYVYLCCHIKPYNNYSHGYGEPIDGRYYDLWHDDENTYEPMKTRGYRSLIWVKYVYLVMYIIKLILATICLVHIVGEIEQGTFFFDSWVYFMILDTARCVVLLLLLIQIIGNEELELGWPHWKNSFEPHKIICHHCDVLIQKATELLYIQIGEFLFCNIYYIFTINSYNIEMD